MLSENKIRFAYFSRASLDYIAKSGKQPDVLHIHNWQTAIVGPLFWDVFVNQVKHLFKLSAFVHLIVFLLPSLCKLCRDLKVLEYS